MNHQYVLFNTEQAMHKLTFKALLRFILMIPLPCIINIDSANHDNTSAFPAQGIITSGAVNLADFEKNHGLKIPRAITIR
jgi:hypothetical protein